MHTSSSTRRRNSRTACLAFCFAAAMAVGESGCTTTLSDYIHNGFKVGPNYQQPPAPLAADWIDKDDPRVKPGEPNLAAWWDVFDDPVLTDLVRKSYAGNLTVRAAAFQILQAREQRAIALGELLPQTQAFSLSWLHAQASANQGSAIGVAGTAGAALAPSGTLTAIPTNSTTPIAGVTPAAGANPTTTPTNTAIGSSVGGAVAPPGVSAGSGRFFSNLATSTNLSWELDFWGLFRRNLEAANANLDQSIANRDELVVMLLANVATQYVEIRTLQKRLELARSNVALQEPLVVTYYQRYKNGVANSTPGYFQLKSNLDNTKALIPQLEISLRFANNQLCILLGLPVHDLLPELGDGTAPDPADTSKRTVHIPRPLSDSVVLDIPGDLLLRRPDVVAAQQQLKIQSAQIGIAEAEMLPHIGINGSIGLAAASAAKIFNPQSWTGSIGPSLTWNILNYGRLLANVRAQNFQYQQFVASYQQTVLNANQDAENALVAYLKSRDQTQHLQDSADSAAKLTNYLVKQFKQGYLPPGAADTSAFINQIFTAINFQVTQQDSAAQAEGNIALNLILLYRAMGGGWQFRLTGADNPVAGGDPKEHCTPVPRGAARFDIPF